MTKIALGKRPRQYAVDIAKLSTREERAAALAKTPKEYQALIRKHVEIDFIFRHHRQRP